MRPARLPICSHNSNEAASRKLRTLQCWSAPTRIARGKFDFGAVGHYARPDVFKLIVSEKPLPAAVLEAGGGRWAGRRRCLKPLIVSRERSKI